MSVMRWLVLFCTLSLVAPALEAKATAVHPKNAHIVKPKKAPRKPAKPQKFRKPKIKRSN